MTTNPYTTPAMNVLPPIFRRGGDFLRLADPTRGGEAVGAVHVGADVHRREIHVVVGDGFAAVAGGTYIVEKRGATQSDLCRRGQKQHGSRQRLAGRATKDGYIFSM